MSWRWGGYDDYFPPSRPRAAKGGIKAQSKRGAFGESWWAKQWITVLEGFNIGARLDRGRSYARRGQVLSIATDKGTVKAKVQGSQPSPYQVTIKLNILSGADWKKLTALLSEQAIFTAKLLAGEMPQEIESVFNDAGLSLFPMQLQDLETECSCPDWSNPCKHIAAVYYLLGEEFDRNPFLLFTLRGMKREELVKLLLKSQVQGKASLKSENPQSAIRNPQSSLPSEPLGADVAGFWGSGGVPEDLFGEVRVPPAPAALVKRLGSFPFWRGEEPFLVAIEPIYVQASARGLDIFLGAWDSK